MRKIASRVPIQILENGIGQLTRPQVRAIASWLLLIITQRNGRGSAVGRVMGTLGCVHSGLAVSNSVHISWRQRRWTAVEDQAGVPRNTMVFAHGCPPGSWRWLHLALRINAFCPHVDLSVSEAFLPGNGALVACRPRTVTAQTPTTTVVTGLLVLRHRPAGSASRRDAGIFRRTATPGNPGKCRRARGEVAQLKLVRSEEQLWREGRRRVAVLGALNSARTAWLMGGFQQVGSWLPRLDETGDAADDGTFLRQDCVDERCKKAARAKEETG